MKGIKLINLFFRTLQAFAVSYKRAALRNLYVSLV